MPHPLLSLAEAHALLTHQCTQTFLSPKLAKGGRPLPWLLGVGDRTLIVEPWSHHHRIHRKKRGFSLMCHRWQALLDSVKKHLNADQVELQMWQDTEAIDISLIAKVAKQIELPIEVYDTARIVSIAKNMKTQPLSDHKDHPNPILATLSSFNHWLCLTDSESEG